MEILKSMANVVGLAARSIVGTVDEEKAPVEQKPKIIPPSEPRIEKSEVINTPVIANEKSSDAFSKEKWA